MKFFKSHNDEAVLLIDQSESGLVDGSAGQVLPGRVGSRVKNCDPVPALTYCTTYITN
jgi:hypothetical protein